MKRKKPEAGVLNAVKDLLAAERIWWMRNNTGTHVLEDENGDTRVFRAGRKGMADLLALVPATQCHGCGFRAIPLWIECKSNVGVQSPNQIEFQAEVEAAGHTYLLVRDVAQVQQFLKEVR